MWFVTPASRPLPANEWLEFVADFGHNLRAELISGTPNDWREIHVSYADDDSWSFKFERYVVGEDNHLWAGDLDYLRSWLSVAQPALNAQWVTQYLTRIQTGYLFECSISAPDSNLELVNEIVDSLRHDDENVGGASGLLYAECEGWSNEDGYHITWEFSDRASGLWWMAIRTDDGWNACQLELSDDEHRRAFKAGEVPAGVESRFLRD